MKVLEIRRYCFRTVLEIIYLFSPIVLEIIIKIIPTRAAGAVRAQQATVRHEPHRRPRLLRPRPSPDAGQVPLRGRARLQAQRSGSTRPPNGG